VFKVLDFTWAESLYIGALLSQTGEFGIIACSLAYQLKIIDYNLFKGALAVTGLTLLCSTIWMAVVKRFIYTKSRIL
jgi:CPA2 family monovalent cation:H+ antiporter-2